MDFMVALRGVDIVGPWLCALGGLETKVKEVSVPVSDSCDVEIKIPEETIRGNFKYFCQKFSTREKDLERM